MIWTLSILLLAACAPADQSAQPYRTEAGRARHIVGIYLLRLEDIVALAKARVTRSLTTDECQKYLHVAACP